MTWLVGLLLLVALGAGCATDRKVIEQANSMHTGLKPAVLEDPMLRDYLWAVEQRTLVAAKQLRDMPDSHGREAADWMFSDQMKFHFVNSETVNAFTTGGEHMYVYTGLLLQCKNEDELAAVLCHEYAHVLARHVHQGMNRQMTTLIAAGALGVAGAAYGASQGDTSDAITYGALGAGVGLVGGQFIGMGFTRQDEAEADKLGFRIYVRAGWDPAKFGDFFQRMIDLGYDGTPAMLSDHPTLASRVEDAKKRAASLPPEAAQFRREPVAGPLEFARLQERARELIKTLPTDKTLASSQALLDAVSASCFTPMDNQPSSIRARQRLLAAQAQQQK